ncbi:unnamed protein product [Lymnaea stagnalis]|uniref:Protein kinase domain-containing protein n=1 Tax=Lymnaea stagnalis TaxID=6523 RepID=A0AAV2HEN4_LYMST
MGDNDQSPIIDLDAMGNNDQYPNTDVDAMGELTLSSIEYGAGENVNDDSEMPALQDERFGERFGKDFDFIKEIASGSFGRVIEASNRIDKKHYAIKIIQLPKSKDAEKKVLGEVKTMAILKDDHIVGYNTAWIDPSPDGQKSHLYIQMELCEKTLNDWLFEKNTRDRIQVLTYFRQIVLAVDAIHSKSFIHRDLKPSNIFISKNGVMKVGDFGLVTIHSVINELEQDAEPGTTNIHSRHKYTRLYASPEQLEGECYDCKADIFSLGLIYLELCIPLQVEEREDMFKRAREGRFPREERFPDPRCRDLLHDMLVKNPARRSTAKDILKHPVLYQNKNKFAIHGNQSTHFHNIQAKHLVIGTGAVMNINCGLGNQTKKIKISPQKPLTKSQEQPSTDQLLDIKEKVGQDWKDLGRRLNFDDSVLEQMHEENQTLDELIYQILRRWKQRENVNATRERLAQVFMKLDRGDLADILADD